MISEIFINNCLDIFHRPNKLILKINSIMKLIKNLMKYFYNINETLNRRSFQIIDCYTFYIMTWGKLYNEQFSDYLIYIFFFFMLFVITKYFGDVKI